MELSSYLSMHMVRISGLQHISALIDPVGAFLLLSIYSCRRTADCRTACTAHPRATPATLPPPIIDRSLIFYGLSVAIPLFHTQLVVNGWTGLLLFLARTFELPPTLLRTTLDGIQDIMILVPFKASWRNGRPDRHRPNRLNRRHLAPCHVCQEIPDR
ncbi:hypothetical protein BJ166DRAFT_523673 [Pestalotiopsis sp. NC0098]|nr:hypothetical protein BJ166DRAFT_523673 [Pestalotiopsis sp. NC0098]